MSSKSKIVIRNTSNDVVTTIMPGTTELNTTATSITLIAKGAENYLKQVNENFYKLLENFAAKKAPTQAQPGQLWFSKKGTYKVEVRGTGKNFSADRYIKIGGTDTNITKTNKNGLVLLVLDGNIIDSQSLSKAISLCTPTYYELASDENKKSLATKLTQIKSHEMFILASWGAIGTNKALSDVMTDKLKSHAWHKIKEDGKYPYAAIGTGTFGIISESLEGPDAKKHAFAQIYFESLIPTSGMGYHTAVSGVDAYNDNLLVWDGTSWGLSAQTIDGRDLKSLRSFVLSGIDLSVKFDKTGGIVNGSLALNGNLYPKQSIVPTGNEIQDLGSVDKRYRNIHLSENDSIYMGVGKSFDKNSFVYTVENETESVVLVPAGSLILNRATGETIVKKSNFVGSSENNTFRKLSQDKKYGVVIGGNNYSFNGDRGVWMGSWAHNAIQYVNISTPGNAVNFGTCRSGGHSAGASDSVRGLSFHQHSTDHIQYITIATPGNATDFGSYGNGWSSAAASDGTRAVTFGGAYSTNTSRYVLFSTPMSAVFFGYLGANAYWNGAVSDGTRAVFDCGVYNYTNQQFRYVSMSTPSDAIYFGTMQTSRGWCGACSNGTYGLWVGGNNNSGTVNSVERLTLATPSNSAYFGTLRYARHTTDPVANETRMVAVGGNTYSNAMDYLSFATGGSAISFGNLPTPVRYSAYFSGN